MGNIINNYIIILYGDILLTRFIVVISLKSAEKSKSLCCVVGINSVVDQLYFKNKLRKDIRLIVTRDGQWEEGELDEGS